MFNSICIRLKYLAQCLTQSVYLVMLVLITKNAIPISVNLILDVGHKAKQIRVCPLHNEVMLFTSMNIPNNKFSKWAAEGEYRLSIVIPQIYLQRIGIQYTALGSLIFFTAEQQDFFEYLVGCALWYCESAYSNSQHLFYLSILMHFLFTVL